MRRFGKDGHDEGGDVPSAPSDGGTGEQVVKSTAVDRRALLKRFGGGAVLFGLAGCQSASRTDTPTGTPAPTATPTPTATESPTPEETPTQTPEPIVFSNRITAGDFDPVETGISGYRERLLRDNPLGVAPSEFGLTVGGSRTRWTPANGQSFVEGIWFFRNGEYTMEAAIGPDPESGDLVVDQLAYPAVTDRPVVDDSPGVGLPDATKIGLDTTRPFRKQFDETIESVSYFDPWFVDGHSDPIWLASSLPPGQGKLKLILLSSSSVEVLDYHVLSIDPIIDEYWGWKSGWLVAKLWIGKYPIIAGLVTAGSLVLFILAVIALLFYIGSLINELMSQARKKGKISRKKYKKLKKKLDTYEKELKDLRKKLDEEKVTPKEAKEKLRELDEELGNLLEEVKKADGKKVDEAVEKIKKVRKELKNRADEEGTKDHGGPVFED